MDRKKIQYISKTGLGIALILAAQMIGKMLPTGFIILGPFNFNQLITGSVVNSVLILLTVEATSSLRGLSSAITAGIISSIMAMLVQIGPIFPQVVIFIALSNIILVFLIYILYSRKYSFKKDSTIAFIVSILISAGIKFLFLKTTIPFALKLIKEISDQQSKILTVMFSWPQLFTALIGGFLALSIHRILKINNNIK